MRTAKKFLRFLLALTLAGITQGALICAFNYALTMAAADVVSFAITFVVTLSLGLASGLGTLYYTDDGLSRPGGHQFWLRPGLMIGLAMAALGLLMPGYLWAKYHVSLATVDWMILVGAPAIAALFLPVLCMVGVAGFRLIVTGWTSIRRLGRLVPCLAIA